MTGRNFGCGSSREHAPWALEDYGFQAIIAPSFADIFRSNCTKIGLLPVELSEPACRAIAEAGEAQIDLREQEVRWPGGSAPFEIDPETKHRLLNGFDDIGLTLEQRGGDQALRGQPPATWSCDHGAVSRPASSRGGERDWDAATYDRVSGDVQFVWALEQLERLPLRGDEVVLDAGCGSGRVTAELVSRLPDGRVYGVDVAPSMVAHARDALDGRARDPLPGPGRAGAARAGRCRLLERHLSLDP